MASSFHENHQFLQYPPPPSQTQESNKPPFFRALYEDNKSMDGNQIPYFNALDHHPPYIPPFQVAGLAPEENNGSDLQWNFGLGLNNKKPKERLFLENSLNIYQNNNNNNSQVSSSLDLLHAGSVSTGLELSLDNPRLPASSGDSSSMLGLVGVDLDRELRRHDAEIDRYVKLQGDRLKQAILEKLHENQLHTISYIEGKVLRKLREKEAEVEKINEKNMELESQIEQIAMEANSWQEQAKYNENLINALKLNLQQVYAQSRDSKEGCGDSEVDDTASCCNGQPLELPLLRKKHNQAAESLLCKVCSVNEVCMLLLPCKHLCLCKECESKTSVCPLCQSSKYIGMEVYR